MLLFLSIVGAFLSVIFLTFNARNNLAIRYLGSFFFLVSLYLISQYGLLYSKSVPFVTSLLVAFAIIFPPLYLTGPLLFWYVRSVLRDDARLRSGDIFHFLPFFIYFLASLPVTFLSLSEKAELAAQVVDNVGFLQIYAATVLSRIFPISAIFLSRPVLILGYAIWSIVIIVKYFSQNKLKGVFSGQKFMIKWLILLTGFTSVLTASHIIDIIHTFHINFSDQASGLNFIRIVSVSGLIGLMMLPFLFPAILYGLPRLPIAVARKIRVNGRKNHKETEKSPNHQKNEYFHSIEMRMETYMKEYQPFLQPQFNLNQLAVQIEVPVHHLAYYFKETKNQTFSEYSNRWRLEHAKKLIREGKSTELTLEAIASLSGFSNRNSFRAAFQKSEGIGPNAFAHQNKEPW